MGGEDVGVPDQREKGGALGAGANRVGLAGDVDVSVRGGRGKNSAPWLCCDGGLVKPRQVVEDALRVGGPMCVEVLLQGRIECET